MGAFYVRQLRDMKGSLDAEKMRGAGVPGLRGRV